jgi:hypothetical protein
LQRGKTPLHSFSNKPTQTLSQGMCTVGTLKLDCLFGKFWLYLYPKKQVLLRISAGEGEFGQVQSGSPSTFSHKHVAFSGSTKESCTFRVGETFGYCAFSEFRGSGGSQVQKGQVSGVA